MIAVGSALKTTVEFVKEVSTNFRCGTWHNTVEPGTAMNSVSELQFVIHPTSYLAIGQNGTSFVPK